VILIKRREKRLDKIEKIELITPTFFSILSVRDDECGQRNFDDD